MKDAINGDERIVQSLHYNGVLVVELNWSLKRHAAQLIYKEENWTHLSNWRWIKKNYIKLFC